jgi:DNA-directed RNA polymerase subunit RPC12/RpoP
MTTVTEWRCNYCGAHGTAEYDSTLDGEAIVRALNASHAAASPDCTHQLLATERPIVRLAVRE